MGRQVRWCKKKIDMSNWIKWWKDKTFLAMMVIAIIAVVLAYVFARFVTWGWVVSLVIGVVGGLGIRHVVVKELNELDKGGNG